LGDPTPNVGGDLSDASNSAMTRTTTQREERAWRDCEIQAVLGGATVVDSTRAAIVAE